MKNIIKNMALVGLLAALAACGGSDTTTNTTTTDPDPTDPSVPTTPDVADSDLDLGDGFGDEFTSGVAVTNIAAGESLSASGSATVTAYIVNTASNNEEFKDARTVYFTSNCVQTGLAEFIPAKIIASGSATSTYYDKGCGKEAGDDDKIQVSLGAEDAEGNITIHATANTIISIKPAIVGAIQYVEALPSLIALSGFGTEETPSLSNVTFQVLDASGNKMPDREVFLELDHEYGSAALSLDNAITDQDGKVTVILKAGNASGTIRIKAGVDIKDADGTVTGRITTMSIPITMATSLADQDSSGIAMDVRNPSAWSRDGTEASVTVHLGDHYQNPVIDGTTVYFRATGGIIEPQCETSGGFCSVTWKSANPRPVDGYVTIVAYTRGQGSYQDEDGDGLFDLGESFTSFGEEYIDANGNGSFDQSGDYQPDLDIDNDGVNDFSWNATAYQVNVDSSNNNSGTYSVASANFYEEFVDSNNNGVLDQAPGNFYQGVNCEASLLDLLPGLAVNEGGHCKDQIDIVLTTRLQMSQSNFAHIEGPFLWDSNLRSNYQTSGRFDTNTIASCVDASQTGGSKYIGWRVADSSERRNNLPNETKVSLGTNDVDILQTNVGNIANYSPELVLPVWEVLWDASWEDDYNTAWASDTAANGAKSTNDRDTERAAFKLANSDAINADKKYDYLRDRGHLFNATILRPETFTTVTGIGTVELGVDTNHGAKYSSNSINVDLQGKRITLASNLQGVVASIDVEDNAQNFTVVIKNACNEGLDAGTLVITTSNGVITAPGAAGSASAAALTATGMEATVDSSGAPTVVTFTLTKDAFSDGNVLNALNITLKVPDPDYNFDNFTNIADYSVKD